MKSPNHLCLIAPRIPPILDPDFRPAALAHRAHRALAAALPGAVPLQLALEQADGRISRHDLLLLPAHHPQADANFFLVERIVKFLLWSRGGWRLHVAGPEPLAVRLREHFHSTPTGRFDSETVAERMFDHPLEVIHTPEVPGEQQQAAPLGRHLEGCRIGFDLGGSDRKAAAVIDGKVVFSDEVKWDPYFQVDPQYHFDGILDSLRKAAAHLPRVDAIGGSAAGIYVNNRVKVASLFRGIPRDVFDRRVAPLFLEMRQAWKNVPFEVMNDGEVTALAGSISLGRNRILGLSLGTSTAGGWVNAEGHLTSWINELAFTPIDYRPNAPRDEWSGDVGCCVQYFSQQCVGRLLAPAGISVDAALKLPEKLEHVQALMKQDDPRARKIYQTIGTYLGYAVAHFADFYDLQNMLLLGRVTSGVGGDLILAGAREVLLAEFPDLAGQIAFHLPDETFKRHGQAIAAASLPLLQP